MAAATITSLGARAEKRSVGRGAPCVIASRRIGNARVRRTNSWLSGDSDRISINIVACMSALSSAEITWATTAACSLANESL